jgi:hypothetical protein
MSITVQAESRRHRLVPALLQYSSRASKDVDLVVEVSGALGAVRGRNGEQKGEHG